MSDKWREVVRSSRLAVSGNSAGCLSRLSLLPSHPRLRKLCSPFRRADRAVWGDHNDRADTAGGSGYPPVLEVPGEVRPDGPSCPRQRQSSRECSLASLSGRAPRFALTNQRRSFVVCAESGTVARQKHETARTLKRITFARLPSHQRLPRSLLRPGGRIDILGAYAAARPEGAALIKTLRHAVLARNAAGPHFSPPRRVTPRRKKLRCPHFRLSPSRRVLSCRPPAQPRGRSARRGLRREHKRGRIHIGYRKPEDKRGDALLHGRPACEVRIRRIQQRHGHGRMEGSVVLRSSALATDRAGGDLCVRVE